MMNRRRFLGLGAALFASTILPTTNLEAINFSVEKPKAWDEVASTGAITELYGNGALIDTDDISIKAPKLAENGGSIPVKIKSSMDLESIAIFQDANPRSLVAVFTIPNNAIIEYDIRIKMRKTSVVTVVAKGKNGKLYRATQNVEVSIGGCGG